MTGIVGGQSTGARLTELLDGLYTKSEYETTVLEDRNVGLALTEHGDRDPHANWVWQDDRYVAIVYGVISNDADLPWSTSEIFPKLFDQTVDVLPHLEGPFLLACCDTKTGEFRVATDKVGSRPCYYTTRDGFHFASELSGLLPLVNPTIDTSAVSDLLLMGTVVGENTLLEEVRNLPPASMISYSDGEVSVQRYWYPESQFDGGAGSSKILSGSDPYVESWVNKHQKAVDRVATTLDSDLALWLSGGIDSRSTAAALKEANQPFTTLSYQTTDGSDQTVAQQVASELGVRNRQIQNSSPSEFVDSIEECIEINDAMQSWSFIASLPFMVSDLSGYASVVMEGGTFLGEDVWAHSLQQGHSPSKLLYEKKRTLSAAEVKRLVNGVDHPRRSLREEVATAGTDGLPYRIRVLDVIRRFYGYLHMRSNVVQRSQVGTRVLSDGSLLDHVLNMPDRYRMNTIPLTDGKIPCGAPRIKLGVMREMSPELADIPYRRTGVAPSKSFVRHVAGFIARESKLRLLSSPSKTYLGWYREVPEVRKFLNSLLDDAADRPFLDADAVRTLQEQTLNGDRGDVTPVAAITGLEYWLQQNVDSATRGRVHEPASQRLVSD